MENIVITKMPYKEKKTLAVILCFMPISAVGVIKRSIWFEFLMQTFDLKFNLKIIL